MSNEEGPATDVATTAVVIVNGASAKYADVIVFIPCHAVILIQCKSFYSDESSFVIEEEANKLNKEILALNKFARVPAGAYFRVLETKKKLNEDADLRGFYVLDTSSPTSLAPLFTPICHRSVHTNKEYKVVRSMHAKRLDERVKKQ
ncbi:Hypothetical protein, putative [Bodo saltans]|uniref:Uncharacterized protein n=1 Tax=Bodo saltans TaxID=75058 RepID=A0A0S4JMQ1_BODSA|nr:Hypothetical protein, putative [Bodo saltans]|eukprot:CUG91482.1 Hypothetical protein, putative [Bodo saltans]